MATFHMKEDAGEFVDYDNLQQVKDNIFFESEPCFPTPPAVNCKYFEIIKDDYEEGPKLVLGFHVSCGKDNEGIWVRNPFDSGARTPKASTDAVKAWLSTL